MSWDTYLKSHANRDAFNHDTGDRIVAWRKYDVPFGWLMFFDIAHVVTPEDEQPDLTVERTTAVELFRQRLDNWRGPLESTVGETGGFDLLHAFVADGKHEWVSLTTWEAWIGNGLEPDAWRANFLRALAAVGAGPSGPDWDWTLDWCGRGQPPANRAVSLFGYAPDRPWNNA